MRMQIFGKYLAPLAFNKGDMMMKGKHNFIVKALMFLSLTVIFTLPSYAAEFIVIVNANNSFAADDTKSKQEVKRLFLKDKKSWPGGIKAKPIGPATGSEAYNALLSGVLDMDSAGLAQHWLRVKQISGQSKPREVKSSRMVTKLVLRDDGALSIVTADTELPDGVKILFEL